MKNFTKEELQSTISVVKKQVGSFLIDNGFSKVEKYSNGDIEFSGNKEVAHVYGTESYKGVTYTVYVDFSEKNDKITFSRPGKGNNKYLSMSITLGKFINAFYDYYNKLPVLYESTESYIPTPLSKEELKNIRTIVASIFENSIQLTFPEITIHDTDVKLYEGLNALKGEDYGNAYNFIYVIPLNGQWGIKFAIEIWDNLMAQGSVRLNDFVQDDFEKWEHAAKIDNILTQSNFTDLQEFFQNYLNTLDLDEYKTEWKWGDYKEIVLD